MTKRYFVPDLEETAGSVALPPTEAQHAIRVMRVKIGDDVELFNGLGLQAAARIIEIGRNRCVCDTDHATFVDREPKSLVNMAIALPKPERAKELVERLTELGIKHVTPLVAKRTQRPPSESNMDKLRKVVIEACKQSGRNHLMEFGPVSTAKDYFQSDRVGEKFIAHPDPDALSIRSHFSSDDHPAIHVAIGPEGGWSESEYQGAITHGFLSINVGIILYLFETAAVALASILVS
ncbi:MAG: RsmE family RNA methyltransferase [Planctomycetota bacterium]|nr:RsmE family RNA methyltransferase [Planctomycetota bacterium]